MPIAPHPHHPAQMEKMFPFVHPQNVPPTQPPNQQQQQQQQQPPPRSTINQQNDTMKKLMVGPHAPTPLPLPFLSPQTRVELLKRPEAQNLLKGLSCGEINQAFLLQHLHNPNAGQREREVLLAVLSCVNQPPQTPDANAPVNGPAIPSPNIMAANQHQIPNASIPPMQQMPNNAPMTPEMMRHLYYQNVPPQQKQQQQMRLSPLPNGMPLIYSHIPSPREPHTQTQNIMQTAMIKKKLEEQRENLRKRQDPNTQVIIVRMHSIRYFFVRLLFQF